jgi:hypothetical protein
MDIEKLKYPTGRYHKPAIIDKETIIRSVKEIELLPSRLTEVSASLSPGEFKSSYRPGGWTALQLIHHIADSHMNSFIRFKLAVTENNPRIKTYEEVLWAETADGTISDAEDSLKIITGLHRRWVTLIKSLTDRQLKNIFLHPELGEVSIEDYICLYAWHGNHHLAQIKLVKKG